jgi:hypothetical protein
MIEITIEGKTLYTHPNTTIQLEVNSSIFDVDKIQGDIIFTFDLPVTENEHIFAFAQYVFVHHTKKYDCVIKFADIPIAHGNLYLQKATATNYSCGVLMSPLPEGFADRQMSENDYGEDLTIASTFSEQMPQYENFLHSTLTPDSIIKFPLFRDDNYYSNNGDFGFDTYGEIEDIQDQNKLVNKLLFDEQQNLKTTWLFNRFTRLWGGDIYDESALDKIMAEYPLSQCVAINGNGRSFAPAINFLWILQKVVESSGYALKGNFTTQEWIKKIYHQSLCTLDKNIAEYIDFEKINIFKLIHDIEEIPPLNTDGTVKIHGDPHVNLDIDYDNENSEIIIKTPGAYILGFAGDCTTDLFVANVLQNPAQLYIKKTANNISSYQFVKSAHFAPGRIEWMDKDLTPDDTPGGPSSTSRAWIKVFNPNIEITVSQNQTPMRLKIQFYQYHTNNNYMTYMPINGNGWIFKKTDPPAFFNSVDALNYMQLTVAFEYKWNFYANKIAYKNHVPTLTNGEFFKNICNLFGLTFFIDSSTKTIELSFIKDVLNSKKAIDISEYCIDKNSEIITDNKTNYSYSLPSTSSEESIENYIGEFERPNDLPLNAFLEQTAFVISENRIFKYTRTGEEGKVETAYEGWTTFRNKDLGSWQPYSGNNQKLLAQHPDAKESNEISPKVLIPVMNGVIPARWKTTFYPRIDKECYSPMFGNNDKNQDMILFYITGELGLYWDRELLEWHYEQATPVDYGNATWRIGDKYDLIPVGEHSIGENFIRGWLNLLINHDTVTYRLLLPPHKFLEILQLLKPQPDTTNQTRWVWIDGKRLLPKKMTFEFSKQKEFIVAQIEFARPAKAEDATEIKGSFNISPTPTRQEIAFSREVSKLHLSAIGINRQIVAAEQQVKINTSAISAEIAARTSAIATETAARTSAINAEAAARASAIATETAARASAISAEAAARAVSLSKKIDIAAIVDSLDDKIEGGDRKVLSAKQGIILKNMIISKMGGRINIGLQEEEKEKNSFLTINKFIPNSTRLYLNGQLLYPNVDYEEYDNYNGVTLLTYQYTPEKDVLFLEALIDNQI